MDTKKNRYSRQTALPEVGLEGQEKLRQAAVLCVGAGGLGSPALLYLAAAGIGRIGIIDFDRVDESNLQRQVLFSTAAIGQSKAKEAEKKLKELNSELQIIAYDEALTPESAARLFPSYDIILDGTDNFEARFLINDAAVKFDKVWIYAAIQGFEGQVSVFNYKGGPCYRCLYAEKPKAQIMNCAEAGVIGAVTGIIGITQALQAVQIIIGHENFEPLTAKLWLLDTCTMQTRTLSLKKNSHCPLCHLSADDIVLTSSIAACHASLEISIPEFKERMDYTLKIDVREEDEWQRGQIENAILWPLSNFIAGNLPSLPKEAPVILYCQKGGRSLQATRIMRKHGFINAVSLSGGYEAWREITAR